MASGQVIVRPHGVAVRNSCRLNGGKASAAIQSLTNAQKLSLPANTPVGTKVQVTDGFVFGPDYFGHLAFFAPNGATLNGKAVYVHTGESAGPFFIAYSGTRWFIDPSLTDNGDAAYDGNEPVPWQADWSRIDNAITHPAVQQLTAPSTAQGGVFVSGGSQDALYVTYTFLGNYNGKPQFARLGDNIYGDFRYLSFSTDIQGDWLHGPSAPGWSLYDYNVGDIVYYSSSNVATPDLATNWKNASDDSPASITVTSVTQGELDAGLIIGSVVYAVSGNQNGRNQYDDVAGVAAQVFWNGSVWKQGSTTINAGNVAIPWQGSPAVSVTRNDVASEANWQVVP